jgi:hypothetical protein
MTDAATLLNETTISLSQAARSLPPSRGGAPVSLACVLRWVLAGSRAPDGQKVKLEAVRLGGRWITSIEALARFAERLTPQPEPSPIRTPRQRRRAAERAERELERSGI